MGRSFRDRHLDALWIVAGGVAIAAAPRYWYSRAWPDQPDATSGPGGWAFLLAFSVAPFVLLGALRSSGVMGRVAAFVALLVSGAVVVLSQIAGLNPTDPSSTASIALVVGPTYACIGVGLIIGVEQVVRAMVSFARSRSNRNPKTRSDHDAS